MSSSYSGPSTHLRTRKSGGPVVVSTIWRRALEGAVFGDAVQVEGMQTQPGAELIVGLSPQRVSEVENISIGSELGVNPGLDSS